jgi:hypothetical protein
MGFPLMVDGIGWPQMWVPIENMGEYGPWTHLTHRHCVMF